MRRRALIAGIVAWGLCGAAWADDLADEVVQALKKQGYSRITTSRTWLGRTRITASSPDRRREIVLNPRTGEILRDYWEDKNGNTGLSVIDVGDEGDHGGSDSGNGSGDGGSSGSGDGSGDGGSDSSGSGSDGSASDDSGSDNSGSDGSGSDGSGSDGSGSDSSGGGGSDSGSDDGGSDGGSDSHDSPDSGKDD